MTPFGVIVLSIKEEQFGEPSRDRIQTCDTLRRANQLVNDSVRSVIIKVFYRHFVDVRNVVGILRYIYMTRTKRGKLPRTHNLRH